MEKATRHQGDDVYLLLKIGAIKRPKSPINAFLCARCVLSNSKKIMQVLLK